MLHRCSCYFQDFSGAETDDTGYEELVTWHSEKSMSLLVELWPMPLKSASESYWSSFPLLSFFLLKLFPCPNSLLSLSPQLPYEEKQTRLSLKFPNLQERPKNMPTKACMLGNYGEGKDSNYFIQHMCPEFCLVLKWTESSDSTDPWTKRNQWNCVVVYFGSIHYTLFLLFLHLNI